MFVFCLSLPLSGAAVCAVFGDRVGCGPGGCAPFCAVLGCAGCGFWYLQHQKRERILYRDWMCVWKCYGNKFGLPGLLVTSMLIVASVWVFAGVQLLRDKLSSVLKLPSRTAGEAQHEQDEHAGRTHLQPDRTAQHHHRESQRCGAAETGTVTPEMGEAPSQSSSSKNCKESRAWLGAESVLCAVDGNKDFADEASKQLASNHHRESVFSVSSCTGASCCSTAENRAGFSSGKRRQAFECMT